MTTPTASAKILCVANQKGGVAKTTTAVSLGAGLALLGKAVLLVDCDSQANATSGVGLDPAALDRHLYHVLEGSAAPEEAIRPTEVQGLDILPANVDLVGIEMELAGRPGRETVLREALRPILGYEIVILDTPPSLGLLTVNALAAAHSVFIPLQCEYYALEGLSQLVNTIRLVKHNFNPRLYIEGILLTMFDARTRLTTQVNDEVRAHFRELVYETTIPRNVRLSESPSHGKPIFLYDPASRGAQSYLAAAREFLDRQRRPR
ncbi:ParA family protein [Dissulfurirhabdus thermomarina]|uniref:ParA family protein n=1 Tax=Dissulfurirhabdus thermomarina TaxID=1765737 RepID=A0A6N9TQ56_DISTH|nr:AAA family ATPase [Dissulfurirhabdus thermomarina]NDY41567.1 ParA family protein [Dissulfurirhabdus thermomarina]NMX22378.1 ParA family protein [Dissulfurirhabdus thermomarina]